MDDDVTLDSHPTARNNTFWNTKCESTRCGVSKKEANGVCIFTTLAPTGRRAPRGPENPQGRRGVALGRGGRRGEVRPHLDLGHIGGDGHVEFVLCVGLLLTHKQPGMP